MPDHTEPQDDLDSLRLPDLQQRYFEVLGEETRCPNKPFLLRRIRQARSAPTIDPEPRPAPASTPTADPEPAAAPAPHLVPLRRPARETPRAERGRFKSMTVEELQSVYVQKVGRPTGSTDKAYLIWKIREAEKGRIPIGPRETRSPDQQGATDVRILPLRLDAAAVEQLDAAWKGHGMKSRMEFFRRALGHYLEHIGAEAAARALSDDQQSAISDQPE
jgi:hypothetical protein